MAWIFVGGSQRTGTSVMQQLLCQSALTNPYVFEVSYLRLQVSLYKDTKNNFTGNDASYFGDEAGLRQFSSLVVRAFLEQSRRNLGNPAHLVLKEPHLTRVWPELYELVPDSIFLLMVRDPRDVIASMIEVGQRQALIGQHNLFTLRNIPKLCQHFLEFYAPVLNISDPKFRERLAIVLYENLAKDPRHTLKAISGFTGIDFESIDVSDTPDTGHVTEEVLGRSELYAPWATELSGRKVSESKIGNYQKVLTASEIAEVEERCAPLFEWFQYERRAA